MSTLPVTGLTRTLLTPLRVNKLSLKEAAAVGFFLICFSRTRKRPSSAWTSTFTSSSFPRDSDRTRTGNTCARKKKLRDVEVWEGCATSGGTLADLLSVSTILAYLG